MKFENKLCGCLFQVIVCFVKLTFLVTMSKIHSYVRKNHRENLENGRILRTDPGGKETEPPYGGRRRTQIIYKV